MISIISRVHLTKAGPGTPLPTPTEAPVTDTPNVTNTPKATTSTGDSGTKDNNITVYIIWAISIAVVVVSIIAILYPFMSNITLK